MFQIKGLARNENPAESSFQEAEYNFEMTHTQENRRRDLALNSPTVKDSTAVASKKERQITDIAKDMTDLDFPVFGDPSIPRSEWISRLKEKLKEIGANGYSIYNWPKGLVAQFLEYPLTYILNFEQLADQNLCVTKPIVHPKEWLSVDTDFILTNQTGDYATHKYKGSPYRLLSEHYESIIQSYPLFLSLFHPQMTAGAIQDQLYYLYMGMWTSKHSSRILVSKLIPSELWHKFGHDITLSEFFSITATLNTVNWSDLDDAFQSQTEFQSPLKLRSLSPEDTDVTIIREEVGKALNGIQQLGEMSVQSLQHYMYVQTVKVLEEKLSKLCDIREVKKFNLQKYESLKKKRQLSYESTKLMAENMMAYADERQKAAKREITPEPQYVPAHELKQILRGWGAAKDTHRLPRLSRYTMNELHDKILNQTLTREDAETVKTYSFAFKSSLKRRRDLLDVDYSRPPRAERHYERHYERHSSENSEYYSRQDSSPPRHQSNIESKAFYNTKNYDDESDFDNKPSSLESNTTGPTTARIVRPLKKVIDLDL